MIPFSRALLSEAPPTELDWTLNKELVQVVEKGNPMESEEAGKKRETVLRDLYETIKKWVLSEARRQSQPVSSNADSLCRLYTFGSYRLGVHGTGADMDTVLIGPRFINAQLFFDSLFKVLSGEPRITELIVWTLFFPSIFSDMYFFG